MREAVKQDEVLGAPSVGTWRPAIGRGAPLTAGMVLGWLVRDGRELEIRAPRTAWGVASKVAAAGSWVQYGDLLVAQGEGGLGGEAEEAASVGGGPEGALAVTADTDGTIYLRPEPGAPAFVDEGDAVDANATLMLVEVMKTFTPVRSPLAGTLARVDVSDGEAVAAGAVLCWVSPG